MTKCFENASIYAVMNNFILIQPTVSILTLIYLARQGTYISFSTKLLVWETIYLGNSLKV